MAPPTDADLADAVETAYRTAEGGSPDKAIEELRSIVQAMPESAVAWFEFAGLLDWLGREADAVAPYEQAAKLGLPAELRPQWALQYGSTLRNVRRSAEAVAVLRDAVARFPEYPAVDMMLALALLDVGEPREAATVALAAGLKPDPDGSVERYRRALAGYVAAAR